MSTFDAIGIAGTGATTYRKWLDAISDNISNMNDAVSTSQGAFQQRYVIAQQAADGNGVQVGGIALGDATGRVVNDPSNPLADANGNVRYPDITVRDCEPYDLNSVRDRIQLIVEVASETTFETDTTAKRAQYAAAGIPGYLVVHFDKDWAKISEIEEYRLDWSGRRYVVRAVHRRALILDDPLRLTVTFDDLQRP